MPALRCFLSCAFLLPLAALAGCQALSGDYWRSPSILTNVIVSIEQHVNFVADCLAHMQQNQHQIIEPQPDAEEAWVAEVNAVANRTLFPRTNSWFMGANVPGKPRVFLPYVGGFAAYTKICDAVVSEGYKGFSFA